MLDQTKVKRTAIILIYVAVFFAIIFIIFLMKSPAATCIDGKQNQGEKGIDCGGPCSPCQDVTQTQDLRTQEIAFANGGNGTYDVVAKIANPNDSVGAKSFSYTFTLKDSEGKIIATKSGTSFIIPGDSRYVAELGLPTDASAVPSNANIEIANVQWERLSGIGKPEIGVYNKNYKEAQSGVGNEASGIIRNESGYDLAKVEIVAVLRDESGKIVGINKTQRNSVRVKEDRDFVLLWPYALGANVQNIEVDPQSNVFDSGNLSAIN